MKTLLSNTLAKIFLPFVAIGGSILLLFTWLYHIKDATKEFEKAKILNLRIDEEIFIRGMEWREYQLLENNKTSLTCEVVRAYHPTVKYRLRYRGLDEMKQSCEWLFDSGSRNDEVELLTLDFLTGDGELIDSMTVKTKVVSDYELIDIYGFETPDGRTISGIIIPQNVKIYAHARVKPFDTAHFTSLFIVENAFDGSAVLQILPVDPEKPELKLMEGKFVRYRRYGEKYNGYAFWTPMPVSVGSEEDYRQVYNIYAGIFAKEHLSKILDLTFEKLEPKPDGGFKVRTKPFKISDIKPFSLNGNGLSPPMRVIRGSYSTVAETLWKPGN